MGNCTCVQFSKNKTTSEIAPFDFVKSTAATITAVLRLSSSSSSVDNTIFTAYYLRFALMYKAASLQVVETQQQQQPTLEIGDEVVSGSRETLLRFVEARIPQPPVVASRCEETTPLLVKVVTLQHRSVMWHLERMVRWARDLATRGRKRNAHPAMGTLKMELRKFGNSYSQLLDIMLEHAQMEERVIFPFLELAEKAGLCKAANEEHRRDLPIMNGIKEFVKSILVLDTASPAYRDALPNLSTRLKSLRDNCKEHFEEEERDVLPLIEAVELSKEQTLRVLEQCFDMMQSAHSDLFSFLIEGLLPCEAFQYLELTLKCKDEELVASMLRRILD
ncbi:hypothetical protein K2173_024102 [Erythroxylum novogranatense]|uniref:Hemerythrin-like domain-containing protein n=1 Tax=Erythroxylum novogranatense TaxID=1862640 RepID=A0AAV8UC60_9ROSI|nr:hypothetical protein K2173_024102 [Erythroxylum novogranatense]